MSSPRDMTMSAAELHLQMLLSQSASDSKLSSFSQARPFADVDMDQKILTFVQYCRQMQIRIQELELQLEADDAFNTNKDQAAPGSRVNTAGSGATTSRGLTPATPSLTVNTQQHTTQQRRMSVDPKTGRSTGVGSGPKSPTAAEFALLKGKPIDIPTATVEVGDTMNRIDRKVNHLASLFKRGNPFEERLKAGIKIQTIIRGFLIRVRYANYKRGLKEWKWLRCRQIVTLLDILLANQNRLTDGYVHLKERMEKRIKSSVYRAWYRISYRTMFTRRKIKKAIEDKLFNKKMNLLRLIFNQLRSVSVGNLSRKFANMERKAKMEVIRNELRNKLAHKIQQQRAEEEQLHSDSYSRSSSRASSANGERSDSPIAAEVTLSAVSMGLISRASTPMSSRPPSRPASRPSSRPSSALNYASLHSKFNLKKGKELIIKVDEEDVIRLYNKQICAQFLANKQLELLKKTYFGFVRLRAMSKQFAIDAASHWLTVRAGKCFHAWKEYVDATCVGINKKVFDGPRTFKMGYNSHRVESFRRRRVLQFVFRPWLELHKAQQGVARVAQRQLARFVLKYFRAFREVTLHQRKLRRLTVDNWKNYSTVLMDYPFQQWKIMVAEIRTRLNEKNRIVNTYLAWKQKHRMIAIMREWRHYALYGKIDALYTRQMLMNSLNEQRVLSGTMERILISQDKEVDRCSELLAVEKQRTSELEFKIEQLNGQLQFEKQETSKAEAKIKRINGIIDALALVNPAQIAHLNKLQTQFKFKERNIQFPTQDIVSGDDAGNKGEGDGMKIGGNVDIGFGYDDDEGEEENTEEEAAKVAEVNGTGSNMADGSATGEVDQAGTTGTGTGATSATPSGVNSNVGTGRGDGTASGTGYDAVSTARSGVASEAQTSRSSADNSNTLLEGAEQTSFNEANENQSSLPSRQPSNTFVDVNNSNSSSSGTAAGSVQMLLPTDADVRKRLSAMLSKDDMLLYDRLSWLGSRLPFANQNTMSLLTEYAKRIEVESIKQPLTYHASDAPSLQSTRVCDSRSGTSKKDKILFTNEGMTMTSGRPSLNIGNTLGKTGGDDYDEFEGVAAKMLLGVMDFLRNGDVTAFSPEDRYDWIAHVLKSAAPVPTAGAPSRVPTASVENATEVVNATPSEDLAAKLLAVLTSDTTVPVEYPDAIRRATDEVAKTTWRNASMAVLTQIPPKTLNAGTIGGVATVRNKAAETQSKIFGRILEMRTTVKEAMKRQIVKYYTRGLPGTGEETMKALSGGARGLIGAAYDIQDDVDEDYYAPINIYAGNLRMSIEKNKHESSNASVVGSVATEEEEEYD